MLRRFVILKSGAFQRSLLCKIDALLSKSSPGLSIVFLWQLLMLHIITSIAGISVKYMQCGVSYKNG